MDRRNRPSGSQFDPQKDMIIHTLRQDGAYRINEPVRTIDRRNGTEERKGKERRESGTGRRENGVAQERRESGVGQERRESGTGQTRRESGVGQERRENGTGKHRRESGVGAERRGSGLDQDRNESMTGRGLEENGRGRRASEVGRKENGADRSGVEPRSAGRSGRPGRQDEDSFARNQFDRASQLRRSKKKRKKSSVDQTQSPISPGAKSVNSEISYLETPVKRDKTAQSIVSESTPKSAEISPGRTEAEYDPKYGNLI